MDMRSNTIIESANLHLVKPGEAQLMTRLPGKRLSHITYNLLEVTCAVEEGKVFCFPESGVGKSLADPYEELVRVSFYDYTQILGGDLDAEERTYHKLITDISLLTSLMIFSHPVEGGPVEILPGLILPAGRDYRAHMIRPFTARANELVKRLKKEKLVNQVDVGILFTLDDDTQLAIATDGYRYHLEVHLTTDEIEQILLKSLPIPLEARIT
jgi:hypothetical protein